MNKSNVIKQMYLAGESQAAIARRVGLSRQRIHQVVVAAGIHQRQTPRTLRFGLCLYPQQMKQYRRAAAKAGMRCSDWARKTLDERAAVDLNIDDSGKM